VKRGIMRKISTSQEIAYLRALAETGNASLAAAHAGVSRDWAYKRRRADARFDALCREMAALARARLAVQQRRPRAGGWNPEREQRFLAALAMTCDVPLAASSAGMTAPSAYRHRARCLGGSFHPSQPNELGGSFHPSQSNERFALGWHKALRRGRGMRELEWFESAECFFEGRPPPPDNPVRVTSIDEVLRMLARSERAERRGRK
jgi:hypothetical protein